MIFLTVGTTMPFDELLEEADRLAARGVFKEELVCQAGQSRYRVTHGEQFMARPSIVDLIDQASLVISHGGATVIQLLLMQKPFIAFPNPRGAGDHQTSFLRQISAVAEISWSPRIGDMEALFATRKMTGAARVSADYPRAADMIAADAAAMQNQGIYGLSLRPPAQAWHVVQG